QKPESHEGHQCFLKPQEACWYFRAHDHAALARRRHRGDHPRRSPAPETPATQGQDREIDGLHRPRHRLLLHREVFAASVTLKQCSALLPLQPPPTSSTLRQAPASPL